MEPPQPAAAPFARPASSWPWPIVALLVLALFLVPMLLSIGMRGAFGFSLLSGLLVPVLLLVGILFAVAARSPSWTRRSEPSEPGLPAPLGHPLYGTPGLALRDRLRAMPPHRRQAHTNILWSLAALVAVAGLAVLAAILAGPAGAEAAPAGFLLLLGWLLTVAAYFAAGFRALLPAAVALGLYGLLLHVESVADAWGMRVGWESAGFLLFLVVSPVQAVAAEAAFRCRPRALWAAWTAIGLLLALALPLWLFLGGDLDGGRFQADRLRDVAAGATLASLPWGLAALFAFAPLPAAIRWTGVAVFALWSATIVLAFGDATDVAGRLQAAGLVAAAITAAVAVTAYFVMRPRAGRAEA